MKKTLALLLSAVLLLTTILVIPLGAIADTAPIEATPLAIKNISTSLGLTDSDSSLPFTTVTGKKFTLKSGGDFYGVNSQGRGSSGVIINMTDESLKAKEDTHLMFRFDANGTMTFSPMLVVSGSWYNLKSGGSFEMLKDGSAQWETVNFTADAKPQIKLDSAFSGYIKIAYNNFSDGSNGVPSDKARPITRIDIYMHGMGTKDSNPSFATEITVGTFFTVSVDSDSNVINVPDEYKPAPVEAIEATPIEIKNIATGLGVKNSDSYLSFVTVTGKKFTLNSGADFYGVNAEGRGSSGVTFNMADESLKAKEDTHLMFRFDANGPMTFSPMLVVSGSWYNLKSGGSFEMLKDGSAQWETVNFTADAKPQIKLDSAFSGYIKIAYNNFSDGSNGVPSDKPRPITRIDIYMHGMGKKDSNPSFATEVTIGTFFTVNKNSTSNEIVVPEEFIPTPIEATPLAIGELAPTALGITDSDAALSFVTVTGKKLTLKPNGDFYAVKTDGRGQSGVRFNMAEEDLIAKGDTHFMFRFEANGPMTFSPMLVVSGSWYNLKSGGSFEILKDGSNKWETVSFTADAVPQIKLDSAFSGYIKIAYNNFNEGGINVATVSRPITRIDIYMHGMGTKDSNPTFATEITIGTFFTVSKNSISNEIVVPEEFRPAPIEATPLAIKNISTGLGLTGSDAALPFTIVTGKKLTLKPNGDFYGVNSQGRGSSGVTFNMADESLKAKEDTHLMFRFDANGPMTFSPMLVVSGSWYNLKSGGSFEMLKDGSSKWETVSFTADAKPQIKLDSAFSGYIKIAYNNFSDGSNGVPSDKARPITRIDIYMHGMGTKDSNPSFATEVTVGTFFTVSKNSTSNEIVVPEEFRPAPIEASPLVIDNLATSITGIKESNASKLSFTDVTGKKLTLNSGGDFYGVNAEGRGSSGVRLNMNAENIVAKDDTHLLFRFEANGAMTFSPMIVVSGSWYNLKSGGSYQILKDGAAKWETVSFTADAKPQIKLDSAFSGYIKIAYNNFSDGSNGVPTDKPRPITRIDIYMHGMGTASGHTFATEVTVGTFFTVSKDADSATIKVPSTETEPPEGPVNPDTPKPAPGVLPSTARPLDIKSSSTGMTVKTSDAEPLSFTSAIGKTFTLVKKGDFYGVNSEGRGTSGIRFDLVDNSKIKAGDNRFIFRLETDGPLTFTPMFPMTEPIEWWYYLAKGATVQLLADGESEWKTIKTTETAKPQIKLDEAFSGYIKLSYTDLNYTGGLSTLKDVSISRVDMYVCGMGQVDDQPKNATEITFGPFFTTFEEDPPEYLAENVWDKSVLPEMVPFDAPTNVFGYSYYGISTKQIQSPIPTLSTNKGFFVSCDPGIDLTTRELLTSPYAAYQNYDYMALGNVTHIMMYIKVPESKDNELTMSIWTGKDSSYIEFKILKNALFALLPLGSNTWEHYYTTDPGTGNWGTFGLPAGFEGFLKIPLETLQPNRANAETEIYTIGYRFGHLGKDSERALVGPVFGVTKDNDPGPAEVVLTSPPTPTTILRPFMIESGDIFPDKVMLSWQAHDDAKEYLVDAYLVQNGENGKTYKLVKSVRAFTNSATITGLEKETQYALVVNAVGSDRKIIATYAHILVKTSSENMYTTVKFGGERPIDGVLYPGTEGVGSNVVGSMSPLVIVIICVAAALVLAAGAVTIVLVVKKRRKTNAEE